MSNHQLIRRIHKYNVVVQSEKIKQLAERLKNVTSDSQYYQIQREIETALKIISLELPY